MMNHRDCAMKHNRLIVETRSLSNDCCYICLDTMKNTKVVHLPCGHCLHSKCLKQHITMCNPDTALSCGLCKNVFGDRLPEADKVAYFAAHLIDIAIKDDIVCVASSWIFDIIRSFCCIKDKLTWIYIKNKNISYLNTALGPEFDWHKMQQIRCYDVDREVKVLKQQCHEFLQMIIDDLD